jgi:hypothetical protein
MNRTYFECSCKSPEHTIHAEFWDEEPKMLCLYVNLTKEVWYKRIWKGIKYIFGHQCRYGQFDEFIIEKKDADEWLNLIAKLKE